MQDVTFVERKAKEPYPDDEKELEVDFDKIADDPDFDPEKQLQKILDCVLPPRRIEERGQFFIQRVSAAPTTRLDLVALQERFEASLQVERAKPFGICPIRRRIYDELFDELIRQVTINCAERGLLLLRIRDEIRLTLLAYQNVLESAIAYGIRKSLLTENTQSAAIVERDEERSRNAQLTAKIEQLQKQMATERAIKDEEIKLLEQAMKDENERLLESNRTLKMHLQSIIQMDQQMQQQPTSDQQS
uniref:Axonemal dynein light chain p33 n=1 Tax=Panagrolaimus sp. JU765 TaxID=591449 RepID=A0AC34QNF8_9BILA